MAALRDLEREERNLEYMIEDTRIRPGMAKWDRDSLWGLHVRLQHVRTQIRELTRRDAV